MASITLLNTSYPEPIDYVRFDDTKLREFATIVIQHHHSTNFIPIPLPPVLPRNNLLKKKISLLLQLWSHYPEPLRGVRLYQAAKTELVRKLLDSGYKKGCYTLVEPRVNTVYRFFRHLRGDEEFFAGVRHILLSIREVPTLEILGGFLVPLIIQMSSTGKYTGEECCLADFTWVKTEADLQRYIEQLPEEI